jgi:D-alanine-D-alanine ligase
MPTKNIAILFGGDSRESEISERSAANILKWIDTTRYIPFMIEVKGAVWHYVKDGNAVADVNKNDFSITADGQLTKFDVALIIIHGSPGENGILQAYLDIVDVPYTTCSAFVSALTFNKFACKAYLNKAIRVHTPKAMRVHKYALPRFNADKVSRLIYRLGLPLFVKPNSDGSSFGIAKVNTEAELLPAIENIFVQGSDEAIVEAFVEGVEVSVGAMRRHGSLTVLPVTEIVSENEFFDYEAKYTAGRSHEITPARLEEDVYEMVQRSTAAIYNALQCSGVVRADYIVKDKIPYFLEINTVPGMCDASIIPQQIRHAGEDITQVISDLIETAYNNKR